MGDPFDVQNIFLEEELSRKSTVRNFWTVRHEGERDVTKDTENSSMGSNDGVYSS